MFSSFWRFARSWCCSRKHINFPLLCVVLFHLTFHLHLSFFLLVSKLNYYSLKILISSTSFCCLFLVVRCLPFHLIFHLSAFCSALFTVFNCERNKKLPHNEMLIMRAAFEELLLIIHHNVASFSLFCFAIALEASWSIIYKRWSDDPYRLDPFWVVNKFPFSFVVSFGVWVEVGVGRVHFSVRYELHKFE